MDGPSNPSALQSPSICHLHMHTMPCTPSFLPFLLFFPYLFPSHSPATHRQWGPGEYQLVLNYSNQQWQHAGEQRKEAKR